MEHSIEKVYFKRPVLCIHCSDYIWGVQLYGLQCAKCYKCFHKLCYYLSTASCEPTHYGNMASFSPIPLSDWSVKDVCEWMAVACLHRYSALFEMKKVDGSVLGSLNEEKIVEMHIKDKFHMEAILIACEDLKNQENNEDIDVNALRDSDSYGHALAAYSFTSLQKCHVCGHYLLGIIQQGYQCRVCGLCCHRRCRVLRLPECQNGAIKKRGSFVEDSCFGKSLDDFSTFPPSILLHCTQELQYRAANKNTKLLQFYRQTPSTNNVLQLKNEIIENASDVFAVSLNKHAPETIGGIVKKFLRDLPEPLIPESFYSDFIGICRLHPSDSKQLVCKLPSSHYLTLEHFLSHLTSDNDTSVIEKLSIIFSNILLRPPWNQIMDIVHNSRVQSQAIIYLLAQRNMLFTRENHQLMQQNLGLSNTNLGSNTPQTQPISQQMWYFGNITKDEVDDLMMTASDGAFLVRNASKWDPSEPYTLTLRQNGANKLIKISKVRDKYGLSLNPPLFNSVKDLIEYYTNNSLASFHRSLNMTLKHPLMKEKLSEQHSIADLQNLRQEFKDLCNESRTLMSEIETLNSEHDTYADHIRVYENNIEAMSKVIAMYESQIEISKEFALKSNKELKKVAALGQKKMKEKLDLLVSEKRKIEKATTSAKKKLKTVTDKCDAMKEKLVRLDVQKEGKKRALRDLEETEENIELLQSGRDVQGDLPHYHEKSWYVDCDRITAEKMLTGRQSGTFLIRYRPEEENHALSIVSQKDRVYHSVIDRAPTGYGFADPYLIHPTLLDLVLHYKDTSLKQHNDALDVTLDYPVLA